MSRSREKTTARPQFAAPETPPETVPVTATAVASKTVPANAPETASKTASKTAPAVALAAVLAIAAAVLFALVGCEAARSAIGGNDADVLKKYARTDLLGTLITISGYDALDKKASDAAFAIVAEIDATTSANRPDSEISAINANAGGEPTVVSRRTYDLIMRASRYSVLSSGAFDITIGAVSELWKSDGVFSVLPAPGDIAEKLPYVGYDGVDLSNSRTKPPFESSAEYRVRLAERGMAIDAGAIAKGYACDMAADYLRSVVGLDSMLLDFGGNIYAGGIKSDGEPWSVGIISPLTGESGSVCALEVTDKAVVTSGAYERYFIEDGVTYGHILDPATGYPVISDLLSVTIIDDWSTRADALSTACFALGLESGMDLLGDFGADSFAAVSGALYDPEVAPYPEVGSVPEGIFITKDMTICLTPGLAGKATVIDDRFALCVAGIDV